MIFYDHIADLRYFFQGVAASAGAKANLSLPITVPAYRCYVYRSRTMRCIRTPDEGWYDRQRSHYRPINIPVNFTPLPKFNHFFAEVGESADEHIVVSLVLAVAAM